MLNDVLSRELSDTLNISRLRVFWAVVPGRGVGCGGGQSCSGTC